MTTKTGFPIPAFGNDRREVISRSLEIVVSGFAKAMPDRRMTDYEKQRTGLLRSVAIFGGTPHPDLPPASGEGIKCRIDPYCSTSSDGFICCTVPREDFTLR